MKYFVEYGNDRCASTDSGLKSKGYKSKVNFTNVHSQNLKRQKRLPVEKKNSVQKMTSKMHLKDVDATFKIQVLKFRKLKKVNNKKDAEKQVHVFQFYHIHKK